MSGELKFCPMCGKKVDPSFKFCMSCGASLAIDDTKQGESNASDFGNEAATPTEINVPASDKAADMSSPSPTQTEIANEEKTDNTPTDAVTNSAASPWDRPSDSSLTEPVLQAKDANAPIRKDAVTPAKRNKKSNTGSGFKSKTMHNAVIFGVALVMLLLAFCPVASMQVELSAFDTATVRFSSTDSVIFFVDSFFSLDDAELSDSDLYMEYTNAKAELARSMSGGGFGVDIAASNAFKSYLRVMLRSDGTPGKFTLALAAISSVVYIVVCLILLLRSFICLILGLMGKRVRLVSSVKLLCTLVGMLPMLYFVLSSMCRFGIVGELDGMVPGDVGMSWGCFLSFAVSLIGIAFIAFSYKRQLGKRWSLKAHARGALLLALTVLMIFMTFAPAMTLYATLPGETDGKADEVSLGVDYTDLAETTSFDRRYYANQRDSAVSAMFEGALDTLSEMSFIERVVSKEDDALSARLSNYIILGCGEEGIGVLFLIVFLSTVCALICLGSMLSSLLKRMCSSEMSDVLMLFARIFLVVFALLNVLFMVILVWVAKYNINQIGMYDSYAVSLGCGTVCTFLLGITSLIVPLKSENKVEESKDYAVSDVSYAPYLRV